MMLRKSTRLRLGIARAARRVLQAAEGEAPDSGDNDAPEPGVSGAGEPGASDAPGAVRPTKNNLSAETKSETIALLTQALAAAIDLQLQFKQAHWNLKGPNFVGLHKLFDEIYESVEEYVDLLAERVVQLGGTTDVSSRSELEALGSTSKWEELVEHLASTSASFAATTKEFADRTAESDVVTSDIFVEVTRGTDKWVWFLESHLQS